MTAFSSYYLDQKYGGDLNNVPNITQNENGRWQGVSGEKYDINPNTGQSGNFIWLGGTTPGFIDVTPKKYGEYSNVKGDPVEMMRNRHGLYAPESAYGKDADGYSRQYQFTTNPNTGEEGKWIWMGQMGWVNIEPTPQPEPAPGTPVYGNYGGSLVGPYNPDSNASAGNSSNNTPSNPPPATPPVVTPPAVVPRTGMLNPEQSSWLHVLNRQGADLESWDPYLGMFTNRESNVDWSQLDSNQVKSSFDSLAGEGLFPSLQQQSIYADLLKRLGYA